MKKKKKIKTVYYADRGETVYSMAALDGKTPKDMEEEKKRRENAVGATARERLAMIGAAFTVYGPLLLITLLGFSVIALLLYLFLK
jgi:hypothetical protein